MGIIVLLLSTPLLINSLLLHSNFLLVKQNTVLHILERVKRPKSRSLAKNPACLMALLKPFSYFSIASFL